MASMFTGTNLIGTDCQPVQLLTVNVASSAHAHIMQGVTVFLLLFMWCTQTVHAQGQ